MVDRHPWRSLPCIVLAAVVVASVSTFFYLYRHERDAGASARAAADRAQRQVRSAVATVGSMLQGLAERDLESTPATRAIRERVHRDALGLLEKLEGEDTARPRARALAGLADVLAEHTRLDETIATVDAAVALWGSEREAMPAEDRHAVVVALCARAAARIERFERDAPGEDLRAALDISLGLTREQPANPRWRRALWAVRRVRFTWSHTQGEAEEAVREAEQALELARAMRAETPDRQADLRLLWSLVLVGQSVYPNPGGRLTAVLDEAAKVFEGMSPKHPEAFLAASLMEQTVGYSIRDQGDLAAADPHHALSVRFAKLYLAANEDLAAAHSNVGARLNDWGVLAKARNQDQEVLDRAGQATKHQEAALRLSPGSIRWRMYLRRHQWNQYGPLVRLKDAAGLAEVGERIGSIDVEPQWTVAAARTLLRAVHISRGGSVRDEARERTWTERAVHFLRESERLATVSAKEIEDPVFDLLVGHDEARGILVRLRRKAR